MNKQFDTLKKFISFVQEDIIMTDWHMIASQSLEVYTIQHNIKVTTGDSWLVEDGRPALHTRIQVQAANLGVAYDFHFEGNLYITHADDKIGHASIMLLPFIHGYRVGPIAHPDHYLVQRLVVVDSDTIAWTAPCWISDEYCAWNRIQRSGDFFLPLR